MRILTNAADATLTIVDDGRGMRRRELVRFHDVAASTKTRGEGIGFVGESDGCLGSGACGISCRCLRQRSVNYSVARLPVRVGVA